MQYLPRELTAYSDSLFGVLLDLPDSSLNGLQVDAGKPVTKIGAAVDACMDAFIEGKNQGCQMIFAHHGMFWKAGEDPRATSYNGLRIRFLFEAGISLAAYHAPLDIHNSIGNNAVLCNLLGLDDLKPFGKWPTNTGMIVFGYSGILGQPKSINWIASTLEQSLPSCKVTVWPFGKKEITKIGVVSGGGYYSLYEAAQKGLDAIVIGEAHHENYHHAKELCMNVIIGGHWATETPGVKTLVEEIGRKFNLETAFISVPTGL